MDQNQNNPSNRPDSPGGESSAQGRKDAAASAQTPSSYYRANQPPYPPSSFERFRNWLGSSMSVQMASIVVIVLLLLIPLGMTRELVAERQGRQQEAIREVSARWGKEQTIIGPVLSIPYTVTVEGESDGKKVSYTTEYCLHILPETLDIDAQVAPEIRRRGIFPVVVYRSTATLKGAFERSAFAHAFPQDATVDWHKAYLSLGLTDQRGIREEAVLTWNGRELPFEPSSAKHVLPGNAIQTGLPASGLALDGEREGANRPSDEAHVLDRHQKQKQQSFQFEIPLVLDGSSGWHTVPVGKQTTVSLAADWADPSFTGAFLPEHDVSDDGFQANWEVFHLNRPFPQLTKTDFGHLRGSSFGVSLLTPVDQYTKTERAVKYGVLVIALTFLALFLVQVMLKRHWHPVRYVLVGLALSLFYVLLLALAEKLGFAAAYALAALATVLLITFYSGGAIRRKAALFGFGSALAAVYGFLFVTLAAEDYALLIGALGLFAVLAAVMALSRRMGVKDAKPEPAQPG